MSLAARIAAAAAEQATANQAAAENRNTAMVNAVVKSVEDTSGMPGQVTYVGQRTVARSTFENTRYTMPGRGLARVVEYLPVHVVTVEDLTLAVYDKGSRHIVPLFTDPQHGEYVPDYGMTVIKVTGSDPESQQDRFVAAVAKAYAERPAHPILRAEPGPCPTCQRAYPTSADAQAEANRLYAEHGVVAEYHA